LKFVLIFQINFFNLIFYHFNKTESIFVCIFYLVNSLNYLVALESLYYKVKTCY